MTMNEHFARALSAFAIVAGLGGAAWVGTAIGHAEPVDTSTVTVDGSDYPICSEEDCSDQPGQIGVWVDPDTGNAWLSLGEYSLPVIDNTGQCGYDCGFDIGYES